MSAKPDSVAPPGAPKGTYRIETWGCQMNVHDSEKLAGALEAEGFVPAPTSCEADVVLLNTCAIRQKAEEKFFSEAGRLLAGKRRRPGMILGVCGCVAQAEGKALLERAPHVDFVLGPRSAPAAVADLVRRLRAGDESARGTVNLELRDDSVRFPFDRIRRDPGSPGKAYVTIVEGCNHRCAFCVVPKTRGREVCRPMGDVLAEVRALAARGVLEVEFLGQTVNAYRDEDGRRLGDLLHAAAEIDGLRRIRFTTSHPAQMTDALIDAMAAALPKVCPYLHLPVQSGSSAVLSAMRRGYDRGGYLGRVARLRERCPGVSLGTDVIVGFPGEGEPEFRETLALLEEVRFDTVYAFAYSPRRGTAAHELADLVPQEVKLDRLARIQARQKEIQVERNRLWLGRTVDVLVEGTSKRRSSEASGRLPENRVVNFEGAAAPGTIVEVEIVRASAYSLWGRRVPREP